MNDCNQCPQDAKCESCSLIVNVEGPVPGRYRTAQEKFEAWYVEEVSGCNGEWVAKDETTAKYMERETRGAYDAWQACAERKDKEIAELREKLVKQQAITQQIISTITGASPMVTAKLQELAQQDGTKELESIRAAERQAGRDEVKAERLNALEEYHRGYMLGEKNGKQAGRAELEQEVAELKAEIERLRDCLLSERNIIGQHAEIIDRLQAHNAMLVEFASQMARQKIDKYFAQLAEQALNATSKSIQQWLDKRDAEVRMNTLLEAGEGWCTLNNHSAHTIRAALRRMAEEVKR